MNTELQAELAASLSALVEALRPLAKQGKLGETELGKAYDDARDALSRAEAEKGVKS